MVKYYKQIIEDNMANKINIAIIGIGDCASALIQGVENYKKNPDKIIGLLPEIKQYSVNNINFVLGIDVNSNKVGKDLSEAIFIEPNCNIKLFEPKFLDAPVIKGPVKDGLNSNIKKIIPLDNNQLDSDVSKEIKKKNVDVAVILLPTGSHNAVKFYAMAALNAGACVINGMPSYVAKDPEIVKKAEDLSLSLIGDDVKSQIGATIIHRSLANLFPMRGAILDRTIQLDWGGSSDFCNLLTPRANGKLVYEEGKRQAKTEAVVANLQNKDTIECQISAVDYIPFLKNQKEAYMRLEGRIFGGAPVRVDITMFVEDGNNSAGVIADCIRVSKIAKDRKIGGVLHSACSFFNKHPPEQLEDYVAKIRLVEFIENKRER
ncbi:MAG: inositol-3-phosphate synthase [Promethearchaeota archaeon Loki_b31]|nr:MAG: inositol-3-phosphate synthase [Candidatus Lokiarchaeota archaeon Loki_b31]